jgi:hypothetical protein
VGGWRGQAVMPHACLANYNALLHHHYEQRWPRSS